MAILSPQRQRRRPPSPAVLLWIILSALAFIPAARAQGNPEYQLKAVFLFRFAQFVDWPPQSFDSPQSPFSICVLGNDPFDGYLDDTVRDERIDNHPFVVRRAHRLADLGQCHILFIGESDAAQREQDLAAVKGQSVLTVADGDDFGREGGIIGFLLDEDRVRLQINPDAARAANLKISSKLLQAAQIVSGGS